MGYDTERFVDFNPESCNDLICPICTNVLENPISTECEHLYCVDCLSRWMHANSTTSRCPICNTTIEPHQLRQVPRITRNMLNNLVIQCDNIGCTAVVKLETLQHHKVNCPFRVGLSSVGNTNAATPSAGIAVIRITSDINPNRILYPDLRSAPGLPLSENSPLLFDEPQGCCGRCTDCFTSLTKKFCQVLYYEAILTFFVACIIMGALFYEDCPSIPPLTVELIILGSTGSIALFAYIGKTHMRRFEENSCRAIGLFKCIAIFQALVIIVEVLGSTLREEVIQLPPDLYECNIYLWSFTFWCTFAVLGYIVLYMSFNILKCLCVFLFG